jgi:hypothetical protein
MGVELCEVVNFPMNGLSSLRSLFLVLSLSIVTLGSGLSRTTLAAEPGLFNSAVDQLPASARGYATIGKCCGEWQSGPLCGADFGQW